MGEIEGLDSTRTGGTPSAHPTIALLIASTADPALREAWAGVESAARDRGVNLLCVVGGALDSPDAAAAQANALYDLVTAEVVDGLLIWTEGLAHFVGVPGVHSFCQRYRSLPLVVAASAVEGYCSVVVDGYAGLREAVAHLVQVHQRQHVALLRGPEGHGGADERYRAYVDVLEAEGLGLDPALVVASDRPRAAGRRAIEELLEGRHLAAGTDFDALVADDAAAAIEAMEVLQERGIRVPQDVAVVAFGSAQAGSCYSPPLSTVPSLTYEQARQATEMLLALMAGQQVPERVTLPTNLLVRQSCGCPDPLIAQAVADPMWARGESFESVLAAQRGEILAAMSQAVEGPLAVGAFAEGLSPRWAEHLLAAFAVEVSGEAPGVFVSNLNRTLQPLVRAGADLAAWQGVISALRRQVLPYLRRNREAWARAEDLFQQARVLIGQVVEQAGRYRLLRAEQQARALFEIDQALGAVDDLEGLAEVLARELPALGVQRCYLSLYEEKARSDWSSLLLAYDGGGRIEVAPDRRRFPTLRLAPEGLIDGRGRYSMTLDSLHSREERLGFVLLERGAREAAIHAPLPLQISNALQRVLPTPAAEEPVPQPPPEAEVLPEPEGVSPGADLSVLSRLSQALAAAPLQPQAIAEIVPRQVCEVLGVPRAAVHLLDAQTGELRVVAAYASEARPGSRSQAADQRSPDWLAGARLQEIQEPLIVQASDRGADPAQWAYMVRQGVDTLAFVPLVVKGEVVGVIELESWAGERDYTPEELELAMILANQAAVALENARLFDQEQQAIQQLGQRVQELDILNEIGHRIDERPALPEFLRWVAGRIPLAMQRPEICVAAIELGGEVFGQAEAVNLPRQVVQSLYVGGERVGRVYVAYTEECDFVNMESAFLGDLSRRLSGYIENRRLLDETQRLFEEARIRADELAVLNELGQALAAHLDVEQVLEEVYRQASRLLDTTNFSIGLYDPLKDEIRFVVDYVEGQRNPETLVTPGTQGFAGYIISTRRPLLIQEKMADYQKKLRMQPTGRPARCYLGVPLLAGDQVLGAMSLQSYAEPRLFSERERDLLTAIASATAVALQNARLFESEQLAITRLGQRLQELDTLNDLGRKLEEAPPLPDLLSWLCERLPAAMQYPALCIVAVEFEGQIFGDPRAVEQSSQMVAGLRVAGERVGKLIVAYHQERSFLDEESALLGDVARRLAGYIENQRLFQQTQQQLADLDVIQSTMSRLAAALSLDDALDLLLPRVAELTQAEVVALYLVDEGHMVRRGLYSLLDRDDLTVGAVERLEDYPLTKTVLEIGRPLAVMTDDPALPAPARQAFQAAGVTASATIPLVGHEGLVGFLTLHRYQVERGFSEREIVLVQTLADQATTTIEKSRLIEQIQHRTVQLETAAQISQAASSILSVDELIEETVDLIRDQFDFYYVGLFLVDQNSEFALLRAGTGEAGRTMVEAGHKLAVGGESMIGQCIAEKQPRIALDVGEEAVRFDNPLLPNTRSELALPLIARGRVQGALTVQSDKAAAFSGGDITVLQTMADHLANALANAHLYSQAQESARRSRALYETSRALSVQLDEEAQLHTIMEAIYRTLGCEMVAIATVDEGTQTVGIRHVLWQGRFDIGPAWVSRSSFPLDHPNILADVCRSGRTEIISGWDDRFDRRLWEQLGRDRLLRVFMPLRVAGENLGVVVVSYDKSVKDTIADDEVQLLAALVGQAAVALRQTRLFAQEQQARALLGVRVKELAVLNDIGRRIDQAPPLAELLPWVAERIPAAMQFPDLCVAAIRLGDQVYGVLAALDLPYQLVQALVIGGEQVGEVYVAYGEDHDFLDEERALLGDIARRLGGYIQNRRLLRDAQTRAEELAVLAELGQSLAASLSVDDVLRAAYQQASRLVETSEFYIGLYEPESDQIRFVLNIGGSELDREVQVVPASEGLTGYIIRNRTSVLLEENVIEGMKELGVELVGDPGSQSWLGVPLLVGDQVLGAMAVQSFTTPRLYDQHDLELMTAIANQTAVALQNARLYEEMQAHAEEQATLRRITEALNRSLDVEEMLDSALEIMVSAMQFDAALISMFDPGSQRLSLVAARGLPPGVVKLLKRDGLEGTLCAHTFQAGEMVCLADVRQGAPVDVAGMVRLGLISYVGTPLVYQDEHLGTICCFNRTERQMTEGEEALLQAIGAQMAVGLANVRLYQETQAALAEVESVHRSYLRRAWEDHLRQRAILEKGGFLYDRARAQRPEDALLVPNLWLPEMERALEEGEAVTVADDGREGGRSGLAIPITLRGETIGILGVEAPTADHSWTDEDLALVQAVSEQLGQALENARLFADAQRRAERERLVSEITGKIRASTEVHDILETAAVELGRVLGTSRALIRLSPADATNGGESAADDNSDGAGSSTAD